MAKRKNVEEPHPRDFYAVVPGSKAGGAYVTTLREWPRVRKTAMPHRKSKYGIVGSDAWQDAVYDLAEISRLADIESLLAVSFRKHRELVLKEGWSLGGKNDGLVRRLHTRLFEIGRQSGRSFDSILRELAGNLVKFHTAFLAIRRDRSRSTGRPIRLHGKTLDPIAALEVPCPTTMQVKQNDSGNITGWRQVVPGQGGEAEWAPDEIICIAIDRKSGMIFGTPYALPVLDDIMALRRLEELSEVVTTKHAFPLVQHKIGSEKRPAGFVQDPYSGEKVYELDLVRSDVENTPPEGSYVTSERHEIVVIGADGEAIDLAPYIAHFESRVYAGLRLSDVDVGRGDGSSKGTATVMKKSVADAVKDYQQVLVDELTFHLLSLLVLEEGEDLNPENTVSLTFPPVDPEEARAKENHALSLFQGNGITQDEFRQSLGREPMNGTKGTYYDLFEVPLAEMKKPENKASEGAAGATKSKSRPQNQHGKLSTKPSIPKRDTVVSAFAERVRSGGTDQASRLATACVVEALVTEPLVEILNEAAGGAAPDAVRLEFLATTVRPEIIRACAGEFPDGADRETHLVAARAELRAVLDRLAALAAAAGATAALPVRAAS